MSRRRATFATGILVSALVGVALPVKAAPRPALANREMCADLVKMAELGPIFKADDNKLSAQEKADLARARKAGASSGSAAPNAAAQGLLRMITGNGGKGAPGSAETMRMLGC